MCNHHTQDGWYIYIYMYYTYYYYTIDDMDSSTTNSIFLMEELYNFGAGWTDGLVD